MAKKSVHKNGNPTKKSSKKKTTTTGTAQGPPSTQLNKALAAYFNLVPSDQAVFRSTIQSIGSPPTSTTGGRPNKDVHKGEGRSEEEKGPSSSRKTKTSSNKTKSDSQSSSSSSSKQTKKERDPRRAQLIAELQSVGNDGKQTGCLSGDRAREIQQELGSETGKGTKKTIKRRIQQIKKELAGVPADEPERARDLRAKLERSETRLRNLESVGEAGHHLNVITDDEKVTVPKQKKGSSAVGATIDRKDRKGSGTDPAAGASSDPTKDSDEKLPAPEKG